MYLICLHEMNACLPVDAWGPGGVTPRLLADKDIIHLQIINIKL